MRTLAVKPLRATVAATTRSVAERIADEGNVA